VVEQRFRKAFSALATDADRSKPTRTGLDETSGSTRIDAHPQSVLEQSNNDFLDPVLCGLLTAQTMWLATRDAVTLRRQLLRVLAVLG
jgi:hypothetical protein